MAHAPFIYVDSSPEPEVLFQPPPISAKRKGKAKARPPPTDEEMIMISDDDENEAPVARVWAEYGVPGPSGTSVIRHAANPQKEAPPPPSQAQLQQNPVQEAVLLEDELNPPPSPIPQWVLDDLMTTGLVAVPSASLNQNRPSALDRMPAQPLATANQNLDVPHAGDQANFLPGEPDNDVFLDLMDQMLGVPAAPQNDGQYFGGSMMDIRIPPRPDAPVHPEPPERQPSQNAQPDDEVDPVAHAEEVISAHLASVLAVIPDVEPDYALGLINERMASAGMADDAVEAVINQLFDSSYPRIEKKKRKRDSDAAGGSNDQAQGEDKDEKKGRIDWMNLDRPSPGGSYIKLVLVRLQIRYESTPYFSVRDVMRANNNLYYPSFFLLRELDHASPFWKKTPTPRSKGKGPHTSPEFDVERKAVLDALDAAQQPGFIAEGQESPASGSKQIEEEEEEVEGGIECGCCFASYAFENMIQCPDAHLFCKTCARRTAEEAIGARKAAVKCMDQDGCQLEFAAAEIDRFLDSKAVGLLEKIKAERAVTDACLEGLEECPFCDFKCIIENDQERLFRCENEDCGVVSCRQCKREDHLPKSCAEVVDDKNLDARHAVEEAMTEALMRKCPKCSKAFIKENGCNKMRCPYCQTMSCYVCRQVINGYDHFNQQPGQPAPGTSKKDKQKCPLWDDLEKRHHDE
ncbi:hypothetical protein FRB90_005194, partial [Tulasnella sp. 427]